MFGQQPGYAMHKHATHGVERSKDDDSISGVCRSDGSLQRQHANSLLAKIRSAAGRMKSAEARAHLTESEVMLSEALKAPLMRSAI